MTEVGRRHPWRRFLVLLVVLAALLWCAVDEPVLFVVLLPGLAMLVGYRDWAAEEFAPTPAQRYARAAVIAGGPSILSAFSDDEELRTAWTRRGVPMERLLALGPDEVAGAVEALRRNRLPGRRLVGARHVFNRGIAVLLGLTAGAALAWLIADDRLVPPPWWLWLPLVVVLIARAGSASLGQGRLAWVADAIRADPAAEMARLDPERGDALVAELPRLAAPPRVQVAPEPLILDALLVLGGLLGLLTLLLHR